MPDVIPHFCYSQQSNWQPLPSWCMAYIGLGSALASIDNRNCRTVIAVAAPIRAYAATFIALGITLSNALKSISSDNNYEFIASQPIGTSVIYRKDATQIRGVIEGFPVIRGNLHINIKTGNLESRYLPLKEYASRITVAENEVKLRDYQKGRKAKKASEFLSTCLGAEAAEEYVSETRSECLIVGNVTLLRSESEETGLALPGTNPTVSGTLQELLRVKQFLGMNQPHRTQITPSSESWEWADETQHPPAVIFDGPLSFLKCSHKASRSHHVVILDRTARAFDDAIQLINQRYINRIDQQDQSQIVFDAPQGVEITVFQEELS